MYIYMPRIFVQYVPSSKERNKAGDLNTGKHVAS